MSARFHVLTPVLATDGSSWRPATGAVGPYAWRLLGANNRDLGRSATVFPDAAACETSIAALRQLADRGVATSTRDGQRGTWTWRLDAGPGLPVARSARGYVRQRECQYALAAFRDVAPLAEVVQAVVPRPMSRELRS